MIEIFLKGTINKAQSIHKLIIQVFKRFLCDAEYNNLFKYIHTRMVYMWSVFMEVTVDSAKFGSTPFL